jgi:predicted permease
VIRRDLRYAVRLLTRTPAFTLPAIASLALGIAINTTMFSVVNSLLLRPLTASDEVLVWIGRSVNDDGSFRSVSYDEFELLQREASSFSDLLGFQIASLSLAGSDGPQFVSAEIVTSNYFRALKMPPTIGRGFDEHVVDDRSVVISERLWRRRFGEEPAIAGRGVSINSQPFTIVGVAPPGFAGTFPGVATDVWLPSIRADAARRTDPRAQGSMTVVGILNRATSIVTAQAELQVLSRRASELNPQHDRGRSLVMASARGIVPALSRRIRPFALAMMAVVGVVLLIVCANVASLLLARASARRSEFAVRLALGAARRQVIAQLLVESLVLAVVGAAVGFALAYWAVRSISALTLIPGPTGTPAFLDLQLDERVLIFTAAVTMLTTIAFGLFPAIQGTRINLTSALKDPKSAPDRKRSRLRGGLVVIQVAVSVVLMVGAVLLFRSVHNSARIDLGFDADRVAVVSFNLQTIGYDSARAQEFYRELLDRARGLSAIERASLADFVPMGGRGAAVAVFNPGSTLPSGQQQLSAAYNRVSDGYFATVGQPLIRGRDFTLQDRPGAPLVAIVNEALARRFWPNEEALGKRIRIVSEPGDDGTEREIVAVAKDAKYGSFGGEVGPFLFMPAREGFGRAQTLHLRTSLAPSPILALMDDLVREIDSNVVSQSSQTMREAMSFALLPTQVAQTVLGVAGVIALLLSAGGLYGLVCYTLEQRLKEIGIRVALGASRDSVFRLLVGGTVRLTAIGVTIGVLVAAGAMRLLTSLLIGLSPTDPLTFVGTAALMLAIALGAGYVAARKGLGVDPLDVLKYE